MTCQFIIKVMGVLNGLEVMEMSSGSGSAFTAGSSGSEGKTMGVLRATGLVIIVLVLSCTARFPGRKKTLGEAALIQRLGCLSQSMGSPLSRG